MHNFLCVKFVVGTQQRGLKTSLLQEKVDRWTHSLAINDLYFDFMRPALAAAGIPGDGAPLAGSASDGSKAAFQHILGEQYQAITVAEPLNLQGWQLVDELNRAIQGEACSGCITALALVTTEGLAAMGHSNAMRPGNPVS